MVLLDHDKTTGRISFRHYAISVAPSGVSRGVKTLVGRRALPSMGDMADVSEFLTKSGYGSVRSLSLRHERKALWVSGKLQGPLRVMQTWEQSCSMLAQGSEGENTEN